MMTTTLELEAPAKERTWHMFCHLSALLGYLVPLGWLIGPFVIWQWKKNEMPSIEAHGREALNFHLSMMIWFFLAALSVFILIGIVILPVLGLLHLIFIIVATVKANDGRPYRYPMTIQFL